MTEDKLGLKDYYEGIAAFLREDCKGNGTGSVTLAIQGGWGEGKTTLMNLIKEELEDEAVKIWFNTWQFSVCSQEVNLFGSLLMRMSNELDEKLKEDGEQNADEQTQEQQSSRGDIRKYTRMAFKGFATLTNRCKIDGGNDTSRRCLV